MATGETMEQIGKYVSEGRGVILSVYSGELNPENTDGITARML